MVQSYNITDIPHKEIKTNARNESNGQINDLAAGHELQVRWSDVSRSSRILRNQVCIAARTYKESIEDWKVVRLKLCDR